MAQNQPYSVLDKLTDVTIEDREFTNTETGEVIEYKRVVLHVVLDGEPDVVEAQVARAEGKSAYKVLRLADRISTKVK